MKMILFQVRDLLHKTCGQPRVAPDLETGAIQIGGLIAENPDFAKHPNMFVVEKIGDWDPQTGLVCTSAFPSISGKEALELYKKELDKLDPEEFVRDGIELEDDVDG